MQYWWLTSKPEYWSFDDDEVGEQDYWRTYNDNGNKRRVFKNYQSVREGDRFIGYVGWPQMEAVCEGVFTSPLDESLPKASQVLGFKKTMDLPRAVPLAEIREDPRCGDLPQLRRGQSQGSLFTLKKEQYEAVVRMGHGEPPEPSDDSTLDLETEVEVSNAEGACKLVYTTTYERSAKNRAAAIAAHGTTCQVCGFDFEKAYGELGKGFIEVHHKKPLSQSGGEVKIDPKEDLVCLCSNCHRMIHRAKGRVFSVDELREIARANGQSTA
jgi:predicted RNA-binding protein with PUA-like domain